jgi:hypothetical protein
MQMAQVAKRLIRQHAAQHASATKRPPTPSTSLSIDQLKLAWADNAAAGHMWRVADAAHCTAAEASAGEDKSAAITDDLALHAAASSSSHVEITQAADETPTRWGGGLLQWLRGVSKTARPGVAVDDQAEARLAPAPSLEAAIQYAAVPRDAPCCSSSQGRSGDGDGVLDRATTALINSASYRTAAPGALSNAVLARAVVAGSEPAS